MPEYIEAVAARFFRSIGPEAQYISPLSKMNVFIGENNSGKSVILDLLSNYLPFRDALPRKVNKASGNKFIGSQEGPFSVAIGVSLDCARIAASDTAHWGSSNKSHPAYDDLQEVVGNLSYNGYLWITPQNNGSPSSWEHIDIEIAASWLPDQKWKFLFQEYTGASGRFTQDNSVRLVIEKIFSSQRIVPAECLIIPAKRQLGGENEDFDDLTGKGLIDHLAELQNPDFRSGEKRILFKKINDFLRHVLDNPQAEIEIPSNRAHVQVHLDGKVLPLSALGTGVHEVILLASFCTIHQKRLMCIEEPEIHLHPNLLKKFIDYLLAETENQYFIASHAASLIDLPSASIFHVENDGDQSFVSPALVRGHKRRICDLLGYRASDIIQSNSVVWVEGPSDRIYLRHWLAASEFKLVENIHYSIMMYGGSLIRHLSANDEAIDQFISLSDLNRNFAIIIDSDRAKPTQRLKPAAKRLLDELSGNQSYAWITRGREVENYVDPNTLHCAVKAVHSKIYIERANDCGPYDHSYYFRSRSQRAENGIFKHADKVGIAREVAKSEPNLDRLDLRLRIKRLAEFIAAANDIV